MASYSATPAPSVEPLPALVLQRVQEGHRLHQVRGEALQQQAALLQRLAHEGEVEHLQVPQAAVDQLAGAAGGARGPVARLHQAGRQAACHGVERSAGAHHARAHHQHVQFPLGHPGEGLGPLHRPQCRCPHGCLPLVRVRSRSHAPFHDSDRPHPHQPPPVDNTTAAFTPECDISVIYKPSLTLRQLTCPPENLRGSPLKSGKGRHPHARRSRRHRTRPSRPPTRPGGRRRRNRDGRLRQRSGHGLHPHRRRDPPHVGGRTSGSPPTPPNSAGSARPSSAPPPSSAPIAHWTSPPSARPAARSPPGCAPTPP